MAKQRREVNAHDHLAGVARSLTPAYAKWETLWNENAALQAKRANPNILFHGVRDPANPLAWKHPPDAYEFEDDAAQRSESASTGAHTSFVTGRTKVYLRLRVVDQDFKPFPNARYELALGGIDIDPATLTPDGDGVLTVEYPDSVIPATVGLLKVFYRPPAPASSPPPSSAATPSSAPPTPPAEVEIRFNLSLGRLDPIKDTAPAGENFMSGVQQRLNNLGLHAGEVNGINSATTEAAIRRLQKLCNVTPLESVSDKPYAGPKTLDWIQKLHDTPARPPAATAADPSATPVTAAPSRPVPDPTPVTVAAASVPTQRPPLTPLEQAQQRLAAAMRNYEAAKQRKQLAYRTRDADVSGYSSANQAFIIAEKEVREARTAVRSLGGTVSV